MSDSRDAEVRVASSSLSGECACGQPRTKNQPPTMSGCRRQNQEQPQAAYFNLNSALKLAAAGG